MRLAAQESSHATQKQHVVGATISWEPRGRPRQRYSRAATQAAVAQGFDSVAQQAAANHALSTKDADVDARPTGWRPLPKTSTLPEGPSRKQ